MNESEKQEEALQFHKPEPKDAGWIRDLTAKAGTKGCEASVGYLLIWRDAFDFEVARYQETLLIRYSWEGEHHYAYPVGRSDLDALRAIEGQEKGKTVFFGVRPEKLPVMRSLFGERMKAEESRDTFDYIYDVNDLADLPGKPYHGKKNHISWFEKNFNWSFECIDEENLGACKTMCEEWEAENTQRDPEGLEMEHRGLRELLEHYRELPMEGGLLRADGRVVAFTLGDAMDDEVFCTHVEKAFSSVRGAYPMINREFARYLRGKGYRLINREEDDGVEGLRKAKLSYHPSILLEKYSVVIEEG